MPSRPCKGWPRCPEASAVAADFPDIPEPMVFDMIRPLGAKRGELGLAHVPQP